MDLFFIFLFIIILSNQIYDLNNLYIFYVFFNTIILCILIKIILYIIWLIILISMEFFIVKVFFLTYLLWQNETLWVAWKINVWYKIMPSKGFWSWLLNLYKIHNLIWLNLNYQTTNSHMSKIPKSILKII